MKLKVQGMEVSYPGVEVFLFHLHCNHINSYSNQMGTRQEKYFKSNFNFIFNRQFKN